jgi:hypothetical protein
MAELPDSTTKTLSGRTLLCLVLCAAFLVLPLSARATLGGSADSVEADRAAFEGVRGVSIDRNAYTIDEIYYGATTVREYVSQGGVVFAVAWNGTRHPDLTALLGAYAGAYGDAVQRTPHRPGLRRLRLRTDGLVVEKWGHVRNLQGRAYAPDLMPAGVSIDEIR